MLKLTEFTVIKLHRQKNYSLKFIDNSLIIVGENGAGKTTILRLLYYVLSSQWSFLSKFTFESILIKVNEQSYIINSSELEKRLNLNDKDFLRLMPPHIRHKFYQLINENNGIDMPLHEVEKLCIQYDIPFNIILREFDFANEEFKPGINFNLNEKFNKLRDAIGDIQILYLPTYRRIEQELSSIFKGIDEDELRNRKRQLSIRKKTNYTELIEFGMKDVEKSIESALIGLKDFARESLNSLTLGYLGDVVDKKYSEVNLNQIRTASEETIKNILKRIDKNILSDSSKEHLSETLETVKNNEELQEHAKVICHYFIKLLNFQQELEIKEKKMRSFCEVCNKYLEGKTFEYNSSTFSFLIITNILNDDLKLDQLSSGEKQIVSLFSHLYLSEEKSYFVMIDEPELSLSVPWQKQFLVDIRDGGFCSGIVAATHSPFIYDNVLDKYAHGLGEFIQLSK